MEPLHLSLSLDTHELGQAVDALRSIRKKAAYFAVRDALSDTAALAHHAAEGEIRHVFTLRNHWIIGGLRHHPAYGRTIPALVSRVGHLNPIMAEQEEGFTREKEGEHGLPIPTPASAAQAKSGRRTRPVRRPNYLSAIKFSERPLNTKTRRQAVAAAIRQAVKKGERFAYIPLERHPGIFRITGKKRPRLTMLYSLANTRTRTEPHKWLEKPSLTAAESMPDIFIRRFKAETETAMRKAGLRAI